MEAKYENYYNILKNSPIKTNAVKLLNSINEYETSLGRVTSQIDSANWEELGNKELKNNLLPQIKRRADSLKNNVNDSLTIICNTLIDDVLPMLKELDEKEKEYNNLETTDTKKNYLHSSICTLERKIDVKINELKQIEIDEGEVIDSIINGQTISMSESEIEEAKEEFIGNIETDDYTVSSSAGHGAQTLRMFYNGVELKNGDTITIKKGETAKVTIKLPTTAGKITALTRNTADGQGYEKNGDGTRTRTDYAWDRWLSAHSEPHCDNRPNSNTGTSYVTNNYEWVITGDQSTNGKKVQLSQTACFTTVEKGGIKSFADLNVIVVDE